MEKKSGLWKRSWIAKMMNRKLHYLVKWEEFGVEHNSWEPWDNIHAPEHIMDFHCRHPGAACHIRATDINSIPFCPSSSFTVLRHHSLEGGVDVRGHPVLPDNQLCIKTFQSIHTCSNDAIVTSHNRLHIEALWSAHFCCDDGIVTSHNRPPIEAFQSTVICLLRVQTWVHAILAIYP